MAAEAAQLAQIDQHVGPAARPQQLLGDAVGDVALSDAVQGHRHFGRERDPSRGDPDPSKIDATAGAPQLRRQRSQVAGA
jgi:hypothetical protein